MLKRSRSIMLYVYNDDKKNDYYLSGNVVSLLFEFQNTTAVL